MEKNNLTTLNVTDDKHKEKNPHVIPIDVKNFESNNFPIDQQNGTNETSKIHLSTWGSANKTEGSFNNIGREGELLNGNLSITKATTENTPIKEISEENVFKTPIKLNENAYSEDTKNNDESDYFDPEYEVGMMSEYEQAKQLLEDMKKCPNAYVKSPKKLNFDSTCKSPRNSGRYKRVELITLASPKTKKLKKI